MDLKTFFKENPSVALGFSGGVDSSYLLYAGIHYGAEVKPYFIKTQFQPDFELEDALRLAAQVGAEVAVLEKDVLLDPNIANNPSDRCYHCKKALFGMLKERALADGFKVLIDGTNASDDASDRPGMRALEELSVRSPLRECGITKEQVRKLSKAAGLFTWNKPAYACLATRIPTDKAITGDLLHKVEKAEDHLFQLGFTDFRVRVIEDCARIQVSVPQMHRVIDKRDEILGELSQIFSGVFLDLKGR